MENQLRKKFIQFLLDLDKKYDLKESDMLPIREDVHPYVWGRHIKNIIVLLGKLYIPPYHAHQIYEELQHWYAINVLPVFIMWLKNKGVYTKFKQYRAESAVLNALGIYEDIKKVYSPKSYLYLGIYFNRTQEGYEYWDRLNDEWQQLLAKIFWG